MTKRKGTEHTETPGNGIGCPSCGHGLHDVDENWQKSGYECLNCGYRGFGS